MNNVFFNSTDGKMVQVQVSELNMLCVCILHPHVYSWRAAFMSCRQNGKKIEQPIIEHAGIFPRSFLRPDSYT